MLACNFLRDSVPWNLELNEYPRFSCIAHGASGKMLLFTVTFSTSCWLEGESETSPHPKDCGSMLSSLGGGIAELSPRGCCLLKGNIRASADSLIPQKKEDLPVMCQKNSSDYNIDS